MSPLPTVNKAYSMITSDENKKSVTAKSAGLLGVGPSGFGHNMRLDSTTMYSKEGSGTQKFRKNTNLFCDVCKMRGHTKEFCYRVVGYPPGFKSKRNEHSAHNAYTLDDEGVPEKIHKTSDMRDKTSSGVTTSGTSNTNWQVGGAPVFSKDQYEQIVKLLSHNIVQPETAQCQGAQASQSSANTAGSLQCESE